MSRFARRAVEGDEEHDISKELFLGIMMLMLCLGIMILNVASPVWRAHQHEPEPGDVLVLYTTQGYGLSADGFHIKRRLSENTFRREVEGLVPLPEVSLHLMLKGGSRELVVRHAAFADSLLGAGVGGDKVRSAVYVHGW